MIHRRQSLAGLSLLAGFAQSLLGAELPAAWKYSQPLQVSRAGLVKISVPLESLNAARPGLEDLRLIDGNGHEVPYLLERAAPGSRVTQAARQFRVTMTANSTLATWQTGFTEAVSGVTLETPAPSFLKAARVEGSTDGSDWQLLAQGQPVFRQSNGASRLQVAIPPGPWSFLRLTLDDTKSAPIPLTGAQVQAQSLVAAPEEPLAAGIVERIETPGQTHLTIRLAGANITLAGLSLETPEPLFTRRVTLSCQRYTENEVRESILAADTVYRVAVENQPAVSRLVFGEDVFIPSREVRLTVQNDDNPPLQIAAIRARRRPVHLTFLGAQAGAYLLLTGNAQCAAPRYDLASLPSRLRGAALIAVPLAALTANEAYRPADALGEIQRPGPALDVSPWRFRKPVRLMEEGVQQTELDLDVLAHADASGRDLRLASGGKQIPYILERTSISRSLVPSLRNVDDPKRPRVSRWQLTLPNHPLPISKLTCASTAAYFKREAQLFEERRDVRGNIYRQSLGSAGWLKSPGTREPTLALALSSTPDTDTLILEIENGDNSPIDLRQIQLWYPVTRILFQAAPDANPFLYYGNTRAGSPQYDLQLLAPRLLAAEKIHAGLAAEEILKSAARSDLARPGGAAGWMFWTVLGLVVGGLLFVIARLLPKPPGQSS